jgi:hypothetical protein
MAFYKWNGSVTGSTDPSVAANWLESSDGVTNWGTPDSPPPPNSTIELNSGTIVGNDQSLTGEALTFGSPGGALFDLTGNSTLDSATTLTFAAASLTDTLEVGGSLENQARIDANFSADTLDVTIDSGATLQNDSFLEATSGGTVDITGSGTLDTQGAVLALGGSVTIDASLDNSIGVLVVGAGGTLDLDTAVTSSQTVVFGNGATDTTLKLDDVSGFSGRILGFQAGDTIDLANVGTLAVTGVSNTAVTLTGGITLHFPGAGSADLNGIIATGDGRGGTVLTMGTADVDPIWNSGTAATGDWSTATLWSTGAVPGSSANVLIDALSSTPYTVTASASVTIGSVVLATSPTGTLAVDGSFDAKRAILQVGGLFDATGSADITTSVFEQRGGGGSLEMDSGSLLTLSGSSSNNGSGTVGLDIEDQGTISSATLIDSGYVLVGDLSGAELVVTGGNVTDTYTSLGGLNGGSCALTIDGGTWSDRGGDSSTTYSGDMLVGGGEYLNSGSLGTGGSGYLLLTNSARLSESASAILAVTMGSTGTALVQNGATWSIANNLIIGKNGINAAVLVQNNATTGGTVTVAGTIYLGGNASGGTGTSGTLDVSGSNSEVSAGRLSLYGGSKINVYGNALLWIGTAINTGTSGIVVAAGATLDGGGNVGGNVLFGTLTDNGTVMADVAGQTLDVFGTITGSGELAVGTGATLNIYNRNTYDNTVAFSGTGGSTVILENPAFQGAITGFTAADTLDLITLPYAPSNTPTYSTGTGILTVGSAILDIGKGYTGIFSQSNDGHNNTDITYACFAAGTRILTEHGEVPVEALSAGDRVLTLLANRLVPVRWIGHRHVDCRRHPRPQDVWPVRVRAHAFGRGLPHRSLLLSPDHAVYVNDVLIPIRYLVNGATIVQLPADAVTWFHVELDHHDVLLAEGLPAESYLDTGNRAAFANGGSVVMAHPDFALNVWEAAGCAPLVRSGPALAAVKNRLLAQAEAHGHAMTEDPALQVIAGGRVVPPQRVTSAVLPGGLRRLAWELTLPRRSRRVRLASRVFVPAELYADRADHRRLGVAVERMALDGVSVPPAARLAGWLPAEDGWQWTDGMATLATGGARQFRLTVLLRLGRYWQEQPRVPLAAPPPLVHERARLRAG